MGEVIDKSLFKRLLTMFASTKMNTSQLEQSILSVTTNYFRVKSLENLQENDIVTYLRYVERQCLWNRKEFPACTRLHGGLSA
mmetsp:Transcript_4435/g.18925  ORF Transcript_4435/g.18925 Transcript_4435/m.18925 type:complete len:83 (-) Transcript_4435:4895-5143(-)